MSSSDRDILFKLSIESKPNGNSILSKDLDCKVGSCLPFVEYQSSQNSHKLRLLFIQGLILIIIFRKPMTWSTVHDEMLCREILIVDPFTTSKKGPVARGTKWEEVVEILDKIQQVYFKVDKRAVPDRYNLLASASLGISFFVKRTFSFALRIVHRIQVESFIVFI